MCPEREECGDWSGESTHQKTRFSPAVLRIPEVLCITKSFISSFQLWQLCMNVFLQGGLVQSGLILVAALLLWGFRTGDEGYGFIH